MSAWKIGMCFRFSKVFHFVRCPSAWHFVSSETFPFWWMEGQKKEWFSGCTENSDFYWHKYLRKINYINRTRCVRLYLLPVWIEQSTEWRNFITLKHERFVFHSGTKYLFLRTRDFVFLSAQRALDRWRERNLRKCYNDLRPSNVN